MNRKKRPVFEIILVLVIFASVYITNACSKTDMTEYLIRQIESVTTDKIAGTP